MFAKLTDAARSTIPSKRQRQSICKKVSSHLKKLQNVETKPPPCKSLLDELDDVLDCHFPKFICVLVLSYVAQTFNFRCHCCFRTQPQFSMCFLCRFCRSKRANDITVRVPDRYAWQQSGELVRRDIA